MKKLEQQGSMDRRIETVLNKFRSRMNAYPPGMCPLALYRSLLQISINQSCGKCVPCRDGLPKAEKLLKDILDGNGSFDSCKKLEDLCLMISKTSDCAVGVVAARMILDSLIEFPDEYQSHIKKNCCVESDGQTIPCSTLCPAHVNIPGYIALIKEGDFEGAVNLIRDRNPFPTACAMICEHPCEKKCRRTMIDQPVNIKGLKRYAVDQVRADQAKIPKPNVKTGKKIAIIGAGPSGLSAAWFLSLMGHEAVVFDEHEKPGGMLRYGIPEYRLPKERLDEDIRAILKTGNIELRCGTKIGRDLSFEKLREEYDAVYLGLGAQIGNRLPIENADAENVIPAADFLQAVTAGNPMDLAGKKVALIGGGNVAMDAARTAVRLHARSVHVLAKYKPSSELPDAEYPFILTTGRILYHYNAAAMTMRSPGMTDISGEGFIEINENDAKRLGISDNERVLVKSRRGEITAAAKIGSKVSEGETWMPFHFPDSPVNRITNPALDEFARIPEYKVCAVAVEKIL